MFRRETLEGASQIHNVLRFEVGGKTTTALAGAPAINFLYLKIFARVSLQYSLNQALVIDADNVVGVGQARAIEIFIHRQNETHIVEIDFFHSENADAHGFEFFLNDLDEFIKAGGLFAAVLKKDFSGDFSGFAEEFIALFRAVPLLKHVSHGKLKESVNLDPGGRAKTRTGYIHIAHEGIPVKGIFAVVHSFYRG